MAEKYGPANITKEAIFETLCGMKSLDMMGLSTNFSYGPQERRAFKQLFIYEIKSGKFTNVGTVQMLWLTPA